LLEALRVSLEAPARKEDEEEFPGFEFPFTFLEKVRKPSATGRRKAPGLTVGNVDFFKF
jgi:hypothetical protein